MISIFAFLNIFMSLLNVIWLFVFFLYKYIYIIFLSESKSLIFIMSSGVLANHCLANSMISRFLENKKIKIKNMKNKKNSCSLSFSP